MILLVTLICCLLVEGVGGTNLRLSINSDYLRHIEEVSDQLLKGMEPVLKGQTFPGSEGTVYKIDNLKLETISLGQSSGSLSDGILTLRLNNASANITGDWESYSFWTTVGDLTLWMAGDMEMNITVGSDNLFNMSDCKVIFSETDLDLKKSSVNWLVPLLLPTVQSTTEAQLCSLLGDTLVNKTNNVIVSLPEEVEAPGGKVPVKLEGVEIEDNSLELLVHVGEGEDAKLMGFEGMFQDACIQLREEAAQSLARIFLPPGTISTSINIVDLLYGEKATTDHVDLNIQNNGTLRVGFKSGNKILAATAVAVEVVIPSEDTSLGNIRMGAMGEFKCEDQGREHVLQYAVNRLVSANKHVTVSGFNLATGERVLVGCGGVKAQQGWVNKMVKAIQESLAA